MEPNQETFRVFEKPRPDEKIDIEMLLTAIQDEDCRRLLEAVDSEGLTAKELADECDVPMSTLYRKLDQLTDLGLLQESIRVREDGNHTHEFSQSVEHITLSIPLKGDMQMWLDKC